MAVESGNVWLPLLSPAPPRKAGERRAALWAGDPSLLPPEPLKTKAQPSPQRGRWVAMRCANTGKTRRGTGKLSFASSPSCLVPSLGKDRRPDQAFPPVTRHLVLQACLSREPFLGSAGRAAPREREKSIPTPESTRRGECRNDTHAATWGGVHLRVSGDHGSKTT